jgi:putative transposase
LARKHGVCEAQLYSEAKRLRQLEDENAKLKKLLAERKLRRCASFCQKNGRPSPGAKL